MKIAILDDHKMIADLLKSAILSEKEKEEVKVYTNPLIFIEDLEINKPDVLITDMSMPNMKGIDLIKICREKLNKEQLKIVVLTASIETSLLRACIKAGANAYLQKDAPLTELIYVLKYIFNNQDTYIGLSLRELLVQSYFEEEPEFNLSPREMELLKFICTGQTVKEIAHELNLSLNTIQSYLKQLMRKMNVNRTADLILKALKYNIVTPN